LDIRQNELTELPESFGGLTALQGLNLMYNELTELPESFTKLTALQTLYLSKNQISSGQIQKLKKQLPNCSISS